jgi:hypothetical protein
MRAKGNAVTADSTGSKGEGGVGLSYAATVMDLSFDRGLDS